MQKERSGEKATVWLAGEGHRLDLADRLGARKNVARDLSNFVHYSVKALRCWRSSMRGSCCGAGSVYDLPARLVEAIFVLEKS